MKVEFFTDESTYAFFLSLLFTTKVMKIWGKFCVNYSGNLHENTFSSQMMSFYFYLSASKNLEYVFLKISNEVIDFLF